MTLTHASLEAELNGVMDGHRLVKYDVAAAVRLGIMPDNEVPEELLEALYPGVTEYGLPALMEAYAQQAVTNALLKAAEETPYVSGEPWHRSAVNTDKAMSLIRKVRFEQLRTRPGFTIKSINRLLATRAVNNPRSELLQDLPQARFMAYTAFMLYPHVHGMSDKLNIEMLDFQCDKETYEQAYFGTPRAVRQHFPAFMRDYS